MNRRCVGDLLREWRSRRRLSQLDLAAQAGISARHLCFIETGRSQPSREMVLLLAEHLQVSLRERNVLLNAAGFSSVFSESSIDGEELQLARNAIDVLLEAHLPFPAFAVDRHWTLVASNGALRPFLVDVDPDLLQPPVNVLRLTLHPAGLGSRIGNYDEWRAHVLEKLNRQIEACGDPVLAALHQELSGFTVDARQDADDSHALSHESHRFVVPFQLITDHGVLSFFSTTTIFGTPVNVTLSELSIESFYPANAATAEVFHSVAATMRSRSGS